MANRTFPARTMGVGLGLAPVAYTVGLLPLPHAAEIAASLGTLSAVAIVGSPVQYLRHWRDRSHVDSGMATWREHQRVASARAMRRRAAIVRPSLGDLGRWQRRRLPARTYATPLVRLGPDWLGRLRRQVWSSCEDVTLRVGGPRSGKTGELACRIIDAPGAVVVTSTKADLVELTEPVRRDRGPVYVLCLDPTLQVASTVKWSPLTGCRSVAVAQRRAADMLPRSTDSHNEQWLTQARRLLSTLMHAAALGGYPMRAILAWVSTPTDQAAKRVDAALAKSPEARTMRQIAQQLFDTNDRTLSSIITTMMPALEWLADSQVAAIGDAQGDDLLELATLIEQGGTLYLLGAEDGATAPLVAALTAEVARQGRTMAGRGRLDPPLTLALDEAALICPVPLPRWTADMGGRGIPIHIAVQSLAQMRDRWGDAGAGTIVTNAATVLVFGGSKDDRDLAVWSALSGERDEVVETRDPDGGLTGTTTRRVPVFSPAQVQALPERHAIVIKRGMRTTYGEAVMAWHRREVKQAQRRAPWAPVVETRYADEVEVPT